jgi:hypothetical protein
MKDTDVIIRLRQLMAAADSASYALNKAYPADVEPLAQKARASATAAANDVYQLLAVIEKGKK